MNAFIIAYALLAAAPAEKTPERSQIPEASKWNLAELYPSDDAWKAAKADLTGRIPKLADFRGTLGKSQEALLKALDFTFGLKKDLMRLTTYATLISDQDTRVAKYQAMKQEISQVNATFSAASSFLEPEILGIPKAKLQGFLKGQPKLKVYAHFLDDIERRKAHTLTPGEEKVIADAGLMASGPDSIYGIFADGDFPFPKVTLSNGKEVTIDKSAFGVYRASRNRDDRKKVFAAYLDALGRYRGTFGAVQAADVNVHLFNTRARHYASCVETSLDRSNIPVEVYTHHLANVEKALPTFHRYLALRKRMLGVDQLHYYDLYAPLVGDVELAYPVEKARETIEAALQPLGADYVSVIDRALKERWIDLYPNVGKRSGAYSEGAAYDVHPYMLLNYNGQYDDASTLIHELGHTMQSYYSNKAQPYPTADYPIFVAEVASTFNEALLMQYLLSTIKDDSIRLALLGNELENMRLTVFRQTQFAEFELRMHQMAEKGEALTGDALDALYLEITRKYYGHDKGVTVVDDDVRHEWMHIPHFYYDFYVFQYATSFTASAALSEKVLSGDEAAKRRYLEFLAAGGSDYPIALLKKAGVDMMSPEPLELTARKMNRIMDEMEQILARTKK